VGVGRDRKAEPGVIEGDAGKLGHGGGVEDGDGGLVEAAVEDEKMPLIGRENGRHRERVERHLPTGGLHELAGGNEEAAAGEGADAFTDLRLGEEDGGGSKHEAGGEQYFFHSRYRWAIG